MDIRLTTYQDLIDHCLEYLGNATDAVDERLARKAVLNAYREVANARNWSFYYNRIRINTVASYSTGTIEYDHTGGANERMLTLTTGTWPSWARNGTVVIANVQYSVATRESDSIITLSVHSNPGADVASTTYSIYQDTYNLPVGVRSIDDLFVMNNATCMGFVHPSEWLSMERSAKTIAKPASYTIMGDPNLAGSLALFLDPAPDAVYVLEGVAQRLPRNLVVSSYIAGTASTTSGSTSVTGSGTEWKAKHVGAVMRFSSNSTPPTGPAGSNPYQVERTILARTGDLAVTVDADPEETLTGVAYTISDPVDIEEGAMLDYLYRACEKQMRSLKRIKPIEGEEETYALSRLRAFESDNRSNQRMIAGSQYAGYRDIRNLPMGDDA